MVADGWVLMFPDEETFFNVVNFIFTEIVFSCLFGEMKAKVFFFFFLTSNS